MRTLNSSKLVSWKRCFSTGNNDSLPSLKRLVSPFLFHCHPDKSPKHIPTVRKVNLNAVQTLFQMMDVVELNNKADDALFNRNNQPCKFDVEFMVQTSEDTIGTKEKDQVWSRRSVELMLSPQLVSIDRSRDKVANQKLHIQAQKQIVKLLRVAGLHMDAQRVQDQISATDDNEEDNEDDESDFLQEELGIGLPPRGLRYQTRFEKSRRRFVENFDHAKHRELYENAYRDAVADLATSHQLYSERDNERKYQFVSRILSRLVMHESCQKDPSNITLQLIALRRMSLIFIDNFESLQMHDFGQLWEEITIVLLPKRENNRKGDSGFKFSLSNDYKVTAHVPTDFLDEEIVHEFSAYLHHVWAMQVQDGIEDFYPPYWKTFT